MLPRLFRRGLADELDAATGEDGTIAGGGSISKGAVAFTGEGATPGDDKAERSVAVVASLLVVAASSGASLIGGSPSGISPACSRDSRASSAADARETMCEVRVLSQRGAEGSSPIDDVRVAGRSGTWRITPQCPRFTDHVKRSMSLAASNR